MITTRQEIFNRRNVAFVISNCHHCRVLKSFIDRFNINLSMSDKINIVDCTKFHDLGIIDNPIIKEYNTYLKGVYPTLFIGRQMSRGANTVEEYRVFLSVRLRDKFILSVDILEYTFNKECVFKNKMFGRREIICK